MISACPECNGKVSDQAEACPHCGHPIKPRASTPPPPPIIVHTPAPQQVVNVKDSKGCLDQTAEGCAGAIIIIIGIIVLVLILGNSVR